jgi:SNF2 family DNA or RNA helicase
MLANVADIVTGMGGTVTKSMGTTKGRLFADYMIGTSHELLPTPLTGPSKATREMFRMLATKENVMELEELYTELFLGQAGGEEPEDSLEVPKDISITMRDVSDEELGVEGVRSLDVKALEFQLGFQHARPLIFNAFRHIDGLNPWDHQQHFLAECQDHLDDIHLHWHQLCAILAIVQKTFPANRDESCTGVLVADEVGLGKTAVGMGFMAFMANAVMSRESKAQLPPCLGTLYFCEYLIAATMISATIPLAKGYAVPDAPHLIVVPGTLVSQWSNELKIFFRPHHIDIFLYSGGQAQLKEFWLQTGPYNQSKHKPCHRVILASHTVSFSQFSLSAA